MKGVDSEIGGEGCERGGAEQEGVTGGEDKE